MEAQPTKAISWRTTHSVAEIQDICNPWSLIEIWIKKKKKKTKLKAKQAHQEERGSMESFADDGLWNPGSEGEGLRRLGRAGGEAEEAKCGGSWWSEHETGQQDPRTKVEGHTGHKWQSERDLNGYKADVVERMQKQRGKAHGCSTPDLISSQLLQAPYFPKTTLSSTGKRQKGLKCLAYRVGHSESGPHTNCPLWERGPWSSLLSV